MPPAMTPVFAVALIIFLSPDSVLIFSENVKDQHGQRLRDLRVPSLLTNRCSVRGVRREPRAGRCQDSVSDFIQEVAGHL